MLGSNQQISKCILINSMPNIFSLVLGSDVMYDVRRGSAVLILAKTRFVQHDSSAGRPQLLFPIISFE